MHINNTLNYSLHATCIKVPTECPSFDLFYNPNDQGAILTVLKIPLIWSVFFQNAVLLLLLLMPFSSIMRAYSIGTEYYELFLVRSTKIFLQCSASQTSENVGVWHMANSSQQCICPLSQAYMLILASEICEWDGIPTNTIFFCELKPVKQINLPSLEDQYLSCHKFNCDLWLSGILQLFHALHRVYVTFKHFSILCKHNML